MKEGYKRLLLAVTLFAAGQSQAPLYAQVYFLVSIHRNLMSKVSLRLHMIHMA
jgi:hypothetical protein